MLQKDKIRQAKILGGAGAALLLLAVIAFLSRPRLAEADSAPPPADKAAEVQAPDRFVGRNLCTLDTERSRVTVSSANEVPLDWAASGCVNARTQYARNGEVWTRILVPNDEQAVSVAEFRPGTGQYVVTRYLLDAATMRRVRDMRRGVEVKSCTGDQEARTILADQLRDIGAVLPRMPNERLVYDCRNQGPAPPPAPAR